MVEPPQKGTVATPVKLADCTDTHDKQIVISVGERAKAALAAFAYLIAQI